jgi:hypothetical protein
LLGNHADTHRAHRRGALAVLLGVLALSVRKGSPIHRIAGTFFFGAMLVGASSAAWLGYNAEPRDVGDVIAGAVTIYFVTTGRTAAKRRDGQLGAIEIVGFLIAATGAALSYFSTAAMVAKGTAFMGGVPGFSFSAVAGLAALLDLGVILRRGVAGRQRIARHLWRMLIAFFVAVGSFFPGQLHLFPKFIRDIEPMIFLFIPPFLIVGIMFFWLARVLFTRWWKTAGA